MVYVWFIGKSIPKEDQPIMRKVNQDKLYWSLRKQRGSWTTEQSQFCRSLVMVAPWK